MNSLRNREGGVPPPALISTQQISVRRWNAALPQFNYFWVVFGLIASVLLNSNVIAQVAQTDPRQRTEQETISATRQPPAVSGRARGLVTHIPSSAGGEEGIAVRVISPRKPRFPEGAPVAIAVAGGHSAGNAVSRMNVTRLGFVELSFAFPDGGQGVAQSGGIYDYRGPNCVEALRDVILFAIGKITDNDGRMLQELVGEVRVLTSNVGLHGGSHGGNACGAAMGLWGKRFPKLAWYVSMESPYGEGAVGVELGGRRQRLNPAYDPKTGVLDLTKLAYDSDLEIRPFGAGRFRDASQPVLTGSLYFDMDGDGKFQAGADFPLQPPVFDVGQGPKSWYSVRLIRETERRALFSAQRPAHIPGLEEAVEFWRYRDATGLISDAVQNIPNIAVIVVAGETDHVQIAPDYPHIYAQINAFQKAGARFVRLNPDRSYVEWLFDRETPKATDNDAGLQYSPANIRSALFPDGVAPKQVLSPAAMCELADRVQSRRFESNLNAVLYSDAPREFGPPRSAGRRAPGGLGREGLSPRRAPRSN